MLYLIFIYIYIVGCWLLHEVDILLLHVVCRDRDIGSEVAISNLLINLRMVGSVLSLSSDYTAIIATYLYYIYHLVEVEVLFLPIPISNGLQSGINPFFAQVKYLVNNQPR